MLCGMLAPVVIETFCYPHSPKEAAEFMGFSTPTAYGYMHLVGTIMAMWFKESSSDFTEILNSSVAQCHTFAIASCRCASTGHRELMNNDFFCLTESLAPPMQALSRVVVFQRSVQVSQSPPRQTTTTVQSVSLCCSTKSRLKLASLSVSRREPSN